MSLQIRDIILYGHVGDRRVVPFKTGRLNIITGSSKTGKSALVPIVNYCFGSSECDVPYGRISKTVAWYAIRLTTGEEEIFVARQAPAQGADTSTRAYVSIAQSVKIPDASDLTQTTNMDAVAALLASKTGIGSYTHEPPEGHTREPLTATARHALAYCLQPQNQINQPGYVFFNQGDHWVEQAIKDTLPYFLGAVGDDFLAKNKELRRKKRELSLLQRRLQVMEVTKDRNSGTPSTLIAEARSLGLLDEDFEDPESWEEALAVLKELTDTTGVQKPSDEVSVDAEYARLLNERQSLKKRYHFVKHELDSAEQFAAEETGFGRELSEQNARLSSIELFGDEMASECPLCGSNVDSKLPSVAELKTALSETQQQLSAVSRRTPHIQEVVEGLRDEKSELREQLRSNMEKLDAVRVENARIAAMRDSAARRAHVLGRISLFVDKLPSQESEKELQDAIARLKQQIVELEEEIGADAVSDRVNSILAILGTWMTPDARRLDLEHSEHPLRFDGKKMNVVADTAHGPVPMSKMGSGENWVGYHLVTHLAFHRWFVEENRPVPGFVFFDQPSQVYFPTEKDLEKKGKDEDWEAVENMFALLHESAEQLAPHLQVIVMEHADLAAEWYQDAITQRWREGAALIPTHWPTFEELA